MAGEEAVFSIGALAKATGCKVETIRYYERIGLLPAPARTGSGYRAYSPAHRDRLSFIRRSRDLGFPLEDIREMLRLSDDRERPCAEIDEIARGHLGEVKRKIADLKALGAELDSMISQCRHGAVSDCGIIGALSPEAGGRRGRSQLGNSP
ncbi:helix-turn-helix domain-containing protein [Inquilinus sp. CAU 1745]|uniref:MerR family transcriptional regulator n=1 Tax=Inquilinus sp. CAU 1745 TaxID=3140369 RepID=UPI00325B24D2